MIATAARYDPDVSRVVEPADRRTWRILRGRFGKIGLWILPEPCKTQTTRFAPFLGRRTDRADHRLHEALRLALNTRNQSMMSTN